MSDSTPPDTAASLVTPLRSLGTVLAESGKVVLAVADAVEGFLDKIAPGVGAVLSAGRSLAEWARKLGGSRSAKAAAKAAAAEAAAAEAAELAAAEAAAAAAAEAAATAAEAVSP